MLYFVKILFQNIRHFIDYNLRKETPLSPTRLSVSGWFQFFISVTNNKIDNKDTKFSLVLSFSRDPGKESKQKLITCPDQTKLAKDTQTEADCPPPPPTKYPQARLSPQKRKLPSINPEALNSQQAAFLSLQKQ